MMSVDSLPFTANHGRILSHHLHIFLPGKDLRMDGITIGHVMPLVTRVPAF